MDDKIRSGPGCFAVSDGNMPEGSPRDAAASLNNIPVVEGKCTGCSLLTLPMAGASAASRKVATGFLYQGVEDS